MSPFVWIDLWLFGLGVDATPHTLVRQNGITWAYVFGFLGYGIWRKV